jgi:two-component system OmpR family response regulator
MRILERVTHAVQRGGHKIAIRPKEYALLEFLRRNAGQSVSRAAIVEQVWKFHLDTMTNVVDVYINYHRRELDLGNDSALIRNIRGVGYQIGESAKIS